MNVVLIGGSGYVGTHMALHLLGVGHQVAVLSRRGSGPISQVQYLKGNAVTAEGLTEAIRGQDTVIYLAGIIREGVAVGHKRNALNLEGVAVGHRRNAPNLEGVAVGHRRNAPNLKGVAVGHRRNAPNRERGGQTYRGVHLDGVRNTLETCHKLGVKRYLHMSALGADPASKSGYSATKGEAEALVRASGLEWTIFRPSLIFGEGDDFFGGVLKGLITALSPIIPQIGDGQFPYRPIWVGDVAACFSQALHNPITVHQSYDLVGPTEYTFRELLLKVRDTLGMRKPLFPIPLWLMDRMVPLMSLLPFSPLTTDLYAMLKAGNTADPTKMKLVFDFEQRSLERELPAILKTAPGQIPLKDL